MTRAARATIGLLSDNRFTLGLGSGENLNEHVVGRGWPPVNVRREMFDEALQVITQLLQGGYVNFSGHHYRVDSAKLWDLPAAPVPVAVAVSGQQSISAFARYADAMVTAGPEAELIPCGPDAGPIIDAVREYLDAGFTDVALVQVGDESQLDFLRFAETELLPALRGA